MNLREKPNKKENKEMNRFNQFLLTLVVYLFGIFFFGSLAVMVGLMLP